MMAHRRIPDIRLDPKAWFQHFDVDGGGSLTKEECVMALSATFPSLDIDTARCLIAALWPLFDFDGSESLTLHDFVREGGLCDTLKRQIPHNENPERGGLSNANVLFQRFDTFHHGHLTKDDCCRGVMSTFRSIDDVVARNVIDALWSLFDSDGSGSLSMEEFSKPGGFWDTLNAQFQSEALISIPQLPSPPPTSPPLPPLAFPSHGCGGLALPPPPPPASGRMRALFVGINYLNTSSELKGCISDVQNSRRLLIETFGWPEDARALRTLCDLPQSTPMEFPTRENILRGVRWLVEDAKRGDVLFFHFSGHGCQAPDPTRMESDGMNECIVPGIAGCARQYQVLRLCYDIVKIVDYKDKGIITDDTLFDLMVKPLPEG